MEVESWQAHLGIDNSWREGAKVEAGCRRREREPAEFKSNEQRLVVQGQKQTEPSCLTRVD